MEFRKWLLLSEKAERTSAKVPLYPPLYHTKQYNSLYHSPYAADYLTWLGTKLQPHEWENYTRIWGKSSHSPYPPDANLTKVGEEHPAERSDHPGNR